MDSAVLHQREKLSQWLIGHRRLAKAVFYIAVISLVIFIARDQFISISPSDLKEAFTELTLDSHAVLLALGLVAFSATGLYDLVAAQHAGVGVRVIEALKIGWIAQAFNNFAGFGGLTGGAIRAKYYTRYGADRGKAIGVSASVWAANLLGLFVIVLCTLKSGLEFDGWLGVIAALSCLYIPLFFFAGKIHVGRLDLTRTTFAKISTAEKFLLLLASVIDWAAAALYFWVCIAAFLPDFAISAAFFIFATATLAGLISFLPAGAGSFDLTVIALCTKLGYDTTHVLLGILVYRVYYYIVPWILAAVLWLSDSVKEIESDFPHRAMARVLSVVTISASLLLFFSALTPEISSRIAIVNDLIPKTIRQASHMAVYFTAVMLLLLARGIYHRVRRCYQFVLILLGIAALACLTRGIDYEEAIYLGAFGLALFASRHAFDRDPLPWKWKSFIPTAALAIAIPLVLGGWKTYRFNGSLSGEALAHHIQSRWPIILFYFVFACGLAVALLFSRSRAPEFERPTEGTTRRLEALINKWGGNAFTHLYYLGDKQVFFSVDKRKGTDRAALMYRPDGTNLVALGDPIGDPTAFEQLFSDFVDYADSVQCAVAIYEIGEEHLARCVNEGMNLIKLGEDATVDITDFTTVGNKGKTFRRMRNKFRDSGCSFEIVRAPYSLELIAELEEASEAWLGRRREMSFSLGFFDVDYLSRAPIAIVRSGDNPNRIEGFASLMPQEPHVASVDLMRIRPDAPDGTMDGIFVNLMQWAKERGYTKFNFGMAPMSNTGIRPHASISEKSIRLVYNYGGRIYNFRGLRKYKEKFKPRWKARYLAYLDVRALPSVTTSLSRLVNRPQDYCTLPLSELSKQVNPSEPSALAEPFAPMEAASSSPDLTEDSPGRS